MYDSKISKCTHVLHIPSSLYSDQVHKFKNHIKGKYDGERENIYFKLRQYTYMFNHSLTFLSDLRSNMVNTDLLPAAP